MNDQSTRHDLLTLRDRQLVTATLLLVLVYVLRHTGMIFGTAVDMVNEGLMGIVLLLVMSAANVSRRTWTVNLVIIGVAVALSVIGLASDNERVTTAANLFGLYLIGFTTVLLLQVTLRHQRVTGDTLFGAVAIYLSAGIVFGIIYTAANCV